MNEYKSQAELLDLYLQALTRDPQTPVPPGLDEKMATFARQLMDADGIEVPVLAAQQRVWEKMMDAAQKSSPSVSSNGRTHSSLRQLNMEEMMNSTLAPRLEGYTTGRRLNFSLVVAALVVMVFAVTMVAIVMSPRGDKTIGAVGLQVSDTPIPQQLTATAFIGNATATAQALVDDLSTPTPFPTSAPAFSLPPYQPALIPLEIDMSVDGAVSADEPTYYYMIQGQAGDVLSVTVNASDMVSLGYSLQYAPQVGGGNSSGGGGGGGGGGPTGQPITQVLTIPIAENAVIIFSVENNAGGRPITYTIDLGQVEVPMLYYGEIVSGTYTPETNPAFPYTYYDFVGRRGDIVDILVDGEGMDAVMRLSRIGDNRELRSDDDSGSVYNPEILGFQLPADGTYRIELYLMNYAGGLETSEYTIALIKRNPIELNLNERNHLTLSDKYPAHAAVFEAQLNQTVELTIEYTGTQSLVSFSIEHNGRVLDQIVAYPSATLAGNSIAEPARIVREIVIPGEGDVYIFANADVSSVRRNENQVSYPLFVDVFNVTVR
ncbi:MAG: hypothetical protein BroJett018_11550 [Chloroflexota bacterium]|nr:hypothetical protein [Chloroflexota bacterium]NOG64638.1 hypothetical protein [Chloroflexota bacterium]GIK63361.1 MAG: hypothetical protein BroJett018_11550 [Chloroflexota bacterium]